MELTFDPAKDAVNLAKHGISLAEASGLDWGSAVMWPDLRRDYGEPRIAGLVYLGLRLIERYAKT